MFLLLLYEPRDKWAQIECLHSILCLWGLPNHEEVSIFHREIKKHHSEIKNHHH